MTISLILLPETVLHICLACSSKRGNQLNINLPILFKERSETGLAMKFGSFCRNEFFAVSLFYYF